MASSITTDAFGNKTAMGNASQPVDMSIKETQVEAERPNIQRHISFLQLEANGERPSPRNRSNSVEKRALQDRHEYDPVRTTSMHSNESIGKKVKDGTKHFFEHITCGMISDRSRDENQDPRHGVR